MSNDKKNISKGLWRVGAEELSYVEKAINSGLRGDFTKKFELDFAEKFESEFAIAVNSGTSALHACMYALGVGPGDEVIVPSLTFIATGFAPLYVGATPVFADIDPDTFLISPEDIRRKITPRTKAIITVSLYGANPDYDQIREIADSHGLKLLEDNAESVFGRYKGGLVGTFGDMSIFSLQRSKHLTTGDGGVITTNDADLAVRARKFADLGYARLMAGSQATDATKEDIQDPGYLRHEFIGQNLRMAEVVAAMGIAQLEKLDSMIEKRQIIGELFASKLDNCPWLVRQKIQEDTSSSYWTFVFYIDNQVKEITWHEFKSKFREFGGDSFYGAWALSHKEPALKHFDTELNYCPVAEALQPKLIQMKTNYDTESDWEAQAIALEKTIRFFDKNRV